jgi:predicted secreted protein
MPTFSHGKDTVFKIADNGAVVRDVSNVCDSSGLARSCDAAEVTSFGNQDKAYIAGLRDATIPVTGFADPTVDGYFAGILGWSTPVAWELYPMGSATGKIKYNGSAILTRYESAPAVGDAVKVTGELQSTGLITRTVL